MAPDTNARAAAMRRAVWAMPGKAPLARVKQGFEKLPGLWLPGGAPIRLDAIGAKPPLDPSLGRIGNLEVRLARSKSELRRAQRLRYEIFYEEMAAVPNALAKLKRRDVDPFDAHCDHLLVLDHDVIQTTRLGKKRPKVVGTYRLLLGERAEAIGFYSAGEFDIAPLLERHRDKRFLELGRSCVLREYRGKRTVELLWHGIWAYVLHHKIDVLLGCASLEGADPDRLAMPLSFLHHHARAPEAWRTRALPERSVRMDRLAPEAVDPKAALHALPPLIKGYLRLGATFGDGAVIDRQFNTTDVLVVLPVSAISARYIGHFGADAGRHAA